MGLALGFQHALERFLGRGLADRAGHRDHLAFEARARGMRQLDQAGEHVVDHEQRRVGGELFALRRRHDGERRAGLQRGINEGVAVMNFALDGEVSITRRDSAAVDREA